MKRLLPVLCLFSLLLLEVFDAVKAQARSGVGFIDVHVHLIWGRGSNEDYEGAEFMLRDREIKLKTGDILLFPSGIVYPHTVKETKKGIRYSFVSWAF